MVALGGQQDAAAAVGAAERLRQCGRLLRQAPQMHNLAVRAVGNEIGARGDGRLRPLAVQAELLRARLRPGLGDLQLPAGGGGQPQLPPGDRRPVFRHGQLRPDDLLPEGVARPRLHGDLQLQGAPLHGEVHPFLLVAVAPQGQAVGALAQVQQDQIPAGLGQGPHRGPVQGAQERGALQGPAGVAVPHPADGAGMKGNHRPPPWGVCRVWISTSVTRLNRRSRRESISTPVSITTKDSL